MLKSNFPRTRGLAAIAVAGICLLPVASFAQRGRGHAFVGGFHGGYAGRWQGGGGIGIGLGIGVGPVYGPSVVVGGYPGYYARPYYPVVPGPYVGAYVAPYVSGGLWIGGGHGGYYRGGYVHGGGGFRGRR